MSPRRRRVRAWPRRARCVCGQWVQRYRGYCSDCGRAHRWGDLGGLTGAECYNCGWMVSDKFSWCPWCGVDIFEAGYSAEKPLKAPKGFRMDARCDWGCGGGVQYPMRHCPWCSRTQSWNEDRFFEGECPHCARGVDDLMNFCPWCGGDSTGRDLIPRALTRVRRLLLVSRIKDWDYRILLRPGVSGVDPKYPDMVEIEQRYVVGKRRRDEIPWTMLVGLITHELGHSFLYHHWEWTRSRQFRRSFGEVDKAYRGMDNTWVYFQRRRIAIAPSNGATLAT